jgi:uncharacterized repeat protein (TIGR02543 family)
MPSPQAQTVLYGDNGTAPLTSPNAIGFKFTGWRVSAAGGAVFDIANTVLTDSVHIYASWQAMPEAGIYFHANEVAAGGGNLMEGTMPADRRDEPYSMLFPVGLETPRVSGYTFGGWWSTSAAIGGIEYEPGVSRVYTHTDVYARWTPATPIDIRFIENTGSPAGDELVQGFPSDITGVAYDSMISPPLTSPTFRGHRFTGWYASAADATAGNSPLTLSGRYFTEDTNIYAGWEQKSDVELTFSANRPNGAPDTVAGTLPAPQEMAYGEVPSAAEAFSVTPIMVGYRFDGWYSEAACNTAFNFSAGLYANTVAYAKWTRIAARYAVSFDSIGNLALESPPVTLVPDTAPSAATGIQYNDKVTAPSSVPEAEGYSFVDWFVTAGAFGDGSGSEIAGNTRVDFDSRITGSAVYYAGWKSASPVSVRYVANNGSNPVSLMPTTRNVPFCGVVAAPVTTPSSLGYRFDGWWTEASGGSRFSFGTRAKITAPSGGGDPVLNIYAHWVSMDAPSVTWVSDGLLSAPGPGAVDRDTFPESGGVAYGTLLARPDSDPSREGYRFLGWFADAGFNATYTFGKRITSNVNIYAKWEMDSSFVAVDYHLGKPAEATGMVVNSVDANVEGLYLEGLVRGYGSRVDLPDLILEGWRFDGWWDHENGGSEYTNKRDTANGSREYYARWTKMPDVNISFDTGGGSAVAAQSIAYNARPASISSPSRSGYDCAGWYTDAGLTSPFSAAARVSADSTLYAKWNAKAPPAAPVTYFTVTFNYGGVKANTSVRVKSGSTVARPQNPSAAGKTFGGWYTGSDFKTPYNFTTQVKKNLTLYAKWTAASVTPKPPEPPVFPNVQKIRTPLTKIYLTKKKSYSAAIVLDGPGGVAVKDKLTWTSSKPKIATVSASGKITAKKTGKAVITAKAQNGKILKINVNVVKKAAALKKLSVKGLKKTMKLKKTAQIKLKLSPSKATNLKVSFKSSRASGLSVDKAGKVTAKKKGKYTITVKVGKKKVKIKITVK